MLSRRGESTSWRVSVTATTLTRLEIVLRAILAAHPKVLKDPESVVEVLEMADSSVNLVVRPWVNTEDYWAAHFDLNRSIKLELERNGFTIPFPQRDIHVFEASIGGA